MGALRWLALVAIVGIVAGKRTAGDDALPLKEATRRADTMVGAASGKDAAEQVASVIPQVSRFLAIF